jgi:hypothetical protein
MARSGYDTIRVQIDNEVVISRSSPGGGSGCVMTTLTATASRTLQPGQHTIEITTDTMDGYYHANAYWEITFTWH